MKKKFLVLILVLSFMIPLFTGFVCFAADDVNEIPTGSVVSTDLAYLLVDHDTISFGSGTIFSKVSTLAGSLTAIGPTRILYFELDNTLGDYSCTVYVNDVLTDYSATWDGVNTITLNEPIVIELDPEVEYEFYSNIYIYYVMAPSNFGEQVSDALTSTFTLGSSILSALASFFDVFVLTDGSLSWITIFLFAMLGISLVVGLTRWLTSLIRRKI